MLKQHFIIFLFLQISTLLSAQQLTDALDSLLNYHYQHEQFSGMVMVAKDGEIVFPQGQGWVDSGEGQTINANTHFPIASITKSFTSVLIFQLIEAGYIDLDTPLSEILENMAIPNAKKITIHHLLTHTSGLAKEPSEAYHQVLSPEEMINRYATQKPVSKPGKQFYYNNLDFIILGLIIEKISGKSWADVLEEKILTPLGMNNSGVLENDGTSIELMTGYITKHQEGVVTAPVYAIGNFYAAAGMYSTAADLFKFDQALYSTQLLSSSILEKMYTSYPEFGYVSYGSWSFRYPFLPNQPQIIERRGGLPGFNHAFLRLTDDRHTIIILSNNDRFDTDTFGNPKNLKEQLITLLYR